MVEHANQEALVTLIYSVPVRALNWRTTDVEQYFRFERIYEQSMALNTYRSLNSFNWGLMNSFLEPALMKTSLMCCLKECFPVSKTFKSVLTVSYLLPPSNSWLKYFDRGRSKKGWGPKFVWLYCVKLTTEAASWHNSHKLRSFSKAKQHKRSKHTTKHIKFALFRF